MTDIQYISNYFAHSDHTAMLFLSSVMNIPHLGKMVYFQWIYFCSESEFMVWLVRILNFTDAPFTLRVDRPLA